MYGAAPVNRGVRPLGYTWQIHRSFRFGFTPSGEPFPPHGYGVTAFSLSDAPRILSEFSIKLPEDISRFKVVEGIRVSDLDQSHIAPNTGPIALRGVWYLLQQIGVYNISYPYATANTGERLQTRCAVKLHWLASLNLSR
jgi:hypothetical protein